MSVGAGPILLAIWALAGCYQDRNDERVPDHLARIAYAISSEARDVDEAAYLVTIGKNESNFCIGVQEKYTHSGGWSTYQLEGWRGKFPGPFVGLNYSEIHNATYAAVRVLRHSHQCGHKPEDILTAYAGRECGTIWPTLKTRVATYWYVRATIKKAMG